MDIATKCREVIAKAADVPLEDVKLESRLAHDLCIDDELLTVEVILALEESFELDIDDDEWARMRTVQDVVSYVTGKARESTPPVTISTFAEYRELASKTDGGHPLSYYAGGIGEEAGEMLELALAGLFSVKCSRLWSALKKHLHHGHEYSREKMIEEIGDGLWLLDQLAKKLGITLEEVAGENIQKLRERYGEAFSEERSRNREGG